MGTSLRKLYRVTRWSKEFIWVRWIAFGVTRRGLSQKIPTDEFYERFRPEVRSKRSKAEKLFWRM